MKIIKNKFELRRQLDREKDLTLRNFEILKANERKKIVVLDDSGKIITFYKR